MSKISTCLAMSHILQSREKQSFCLDYSLVSRLNAVREIENVDKNIPKVCVENFWSHDIFIVEILVSVPKKFREATFLRRDITCLSTD